MKMLDNHTKTLAHLCQPSLTLFLDDITFKLVSSMNQGTTPEDAAASIQQHISIFEDLRGNINSLENELLTLAGCGKEVDALKQTLHRVRHTVACLEDLYCTCLEGHEVLKGAHSEQNLLYQQRMNT
jgi:hypothetical protein